MLSHFVVVCCLAAPGDAPAPNAVADHAAKPAAQAPPGPADPPIVLDCRPSSVQINTSMSFDEKGEVAHTHHQSHLGVAVRYKSPVRIVGVRGVEVKKIVTDSGQVVPPVKGPREYHSDVQRGGEAMFHLSIQLPALPTRAKSLGEVSGTVKLLCGRGPVRFAALGPWKDVTNKTVRIEGMAQPFVVGVKSERENRRVRLEYPRTGVILESVRAQDGHGRDVRLDEQGGGSSDGVSVKYLGGTVPEDGQLVLAFYAEAREVEVPFILRDVPLPKPPSATSPDIVVQARDKPPTKPRAAGNPLKVIVE